MAKKNGCNLLEQEREEERAAKREGDVVRAEPGEEDVGRLVAQEVLDGEDGGEIRGHDGEHYGGRRDGRDAGLPGREVSRHHGERERRVCEDYVCQLHSHCC